MGAMMGVRSRTRVRVMVLNSTFNNISVKSWQKIWLVEEIRVRGEISTRHCQTLSHKVVSSTTPRHERDSNSQLWRRSLRPTRQSDCSSTDFMRYYQLFIYLINWKISANIIKHGTFVGCHWCTIFNDIQKFVCCTSR